MKYLLICMMIVAAAACGKSTGSPSSHALTGSWRLFRYTGGYAGVDVTLQPSDRTTLYSFTKDGLLRVFRADTLFSELPYSITSEYMGDERVTVLNTVAPYATSKNLVMLENNILHLRTLDIMCAIDNYYIREK